MTSNKSSSHPSDDDRWAELPELLNASETDGHARDRVVTLLYPELKRIAEAHMRRERRDHTLQATALVSEFFVQLADNPAFTARSRNQFLMVASVAMRHLLVDYARARNADKRGGQQVRVEIENANASETASFVDILAVDALLTQLAASDERLAKVVELRFFGGLTNAEIGSVLGVHERTIKRDWQVARAWLYSRLRRDGNDVSRGLGPN
jgi:RNA polymerase sigma factor (TIGR02999 family)